MGNWNQSNDYESEAYGVGIENARPTGDGGISYVNQAGIPVTDYSRQFQGMANQINRGGGSDPVISQQDVINGYNLPAQTSFSYPQAASISQPRSYSDVRGLVSDALVARPDLATPANTSVTGIAGLASRAREQGTTRTLGKPVFDEPTRSGGMTPIMDTIRSGYEALKGGVNALGGQINLQSLPGGGFGINYLRQFGKGGEATNDGPRVNVNASGDARYEDDFIARRSENYDVSISNLPVIDDVTFALQGGYGKTTIDPKFLPEEFRRDFVFQNRKVGGDLQYLDDEGRGISIGGTRYSGTNMEPMAEGRMSAQYPVGGGIVSLRASKPLDRGQKPNYFIEFSKNFKDGGEAQSMDRETSDVAMQSREAYLPQSFFGNVTSTDSGIMSTMEGLRESDPEAFAEMMRRNTEKEIERLNMLQFDDDEILAKSGDPVLDRYLIDEAVYRTVVAPGFERTNDMEPYRTQSVTGGVTTNERLLSPGYTPRSMVPGDEMSATNVLHETAHDILPRSREGMFGAANTEEAAVIGLDLYKAFKAGDREGFDNALGYLSSNDVGVYLADPFKFDDMRQNLTSTIEYMYEQSGNPMSSEQKQALDSEVYSILKKGAQEQFRMQYEGRR